MVRHFCGSDIIASHIWHGHNLKPDVRMLQVLKMKATALVFEPGINYMPTFGSFADVLHCGLPRNQNNYSDYRENQSDYIKQATRPLGCGLE